MFGPAFLYVTIFRLLICYVPTRSLLCFMFFLPSYDGKKWGTLCPFLPTTMAKHHLLGSSRISTIAAATNGAPATPILQAVLPALSIARVVSHVLSAPFPEVFCASLPVAVCRRRVAALLCIPTPPPPQVPRYIFGINVSTSSARAAGERQLQPRTHPPTHSHLH